MSETVTYSVPAIHCAHCAMSIREEISEVEGVEGIDVDLDSKVVTVSGRELDDASCSVVVAVNEKMPVAHARRYPPSVAQFPSDDVTDRRPSNRRHERGVRWAPTRLGGCREPVRVGRSIAAWSQRRGRE